MKIKILALAMLAAASMSAQEAADTVLHVNNANRVYIQQNSEGLKIKVDGTSSDSSFTTEYSEVYDGDYAVESKVLFGFKRFSKRKDSFWKNDDITINGFGFGMVATPGGTEAAGFEVGKSFEFTWLNMLAWVHRFSRNGYLSIGAGMNWRNYRNSRGTVMFTADELGDAVMSRFPDGASSCASQIKVVRFGFPILWQQRFLRDKSLWIGPIINLTTHATAKSTWTDPATGHKQQSCRNINTRLCTIDLYAQLNFAQHFGVYWRWTPQSVLKTPTTDTPKFTGMSFGITTLF